MTRIRQWLRSLPSKPTEFVEPFAGGGIVGLTVAFEELACRVTLAERDEQVAAVWQTILGEDGAWLADKIVGFTVTEESVKAEFARSPQSVREAAFQTILKNRVNHGGIIAAGSGTLKHGENGKGLTSRWYLETLRKRIVDIGNVRQRLCFVHGDGLALLAEHRDRSDAMLFLDPPYTAAGKKAGKRLYTYHRLDHEQLFAVAATLRGDFLMTYDNAGGVVDLAQRHGFDMETVTMKNTHHAEMSELLIGRDLDWLRRAARNQ